MISKTFLTTASMLVLYFVFVSEFAPRWWVSGQSQWQANLSKAQNFLYDDSDSIQNVIIGSSLAARLVTDSLPNAYNLSFSGKSVFDGLNILYKKTKMPQTVYIETNVIDRAPSPEFTALINNTLMYYPRKWIRGLREDKQPMAILGLMQINGLKEIMSFISKKPVKTEVGGISGQPDELNPMFDQLLQLQDKEYSIQPNQVSLDSLFISLKNHVKNLQSKGVKVIFFEMPVNQRLQILPRAKVIEASFRAYFPASKYTYIPVLGSQHFHTTDGIHLGKNEALTYTILFRKAIQTDRW